jgi:hypothetical protein
MKTQTIQAIKCNICGTLHDITENTFISIDGNICSGSGGGIIGNNFDDSGKLIRSFIFCNTTHCMIKFIEKINVSNHNLNSVGFREYI